MKLSERLEAKLNEQVTLEYEAAWIYNAMRIYLDDLGTPGATQWMTAQAREELGHAQDFINIILDHQGSVKLGSLEAPRSDYDGFLSVWEAGLEHEKSITKSITEALEIAIEDKNYAAENFLRTYVDEQLEEESNFIGVIDLIKMAGEDKQAIFEVDQILGQRQ